VLQTAGLKSKKNVSIKIKRKNCCGARWNLLFEMDFLLHTSLDMFPGAFMESWRQD
jgi:hypothetical protein